VGKPAQSVKHAERLSRVLPRVCPGTQRNVQHDVAHLLILIFLGIARTAPTGCERSHYTQEITVKDNHKIGAA
jgi:hypothetical protein